MGLLEVNTKFVDQGKKHGVKTPHVVGLLRVKYAPPGVNVDDLIGDDLIVYRRALRWQRLRGVQHLLNGSRVVKCYRVRIAPNVKVMRSTKNKRAFYGGGLMICGSVWTCPICAAKITERRKNELMNAPKIGEFDMFMVTFTLQHDRDDRLKKLHRDLVAGMRRMKQSKGYRKLMRDLAVVGAVRGLEVMISNKSGWHPHVHELWFIPKGTPIDAEAIRAELSRLYVAAMKKQRRYVHADIGVNVRADHVIASYVAKMGEGENKKSWSAVAELTKSPVKTGRLEDHFHPFELIDMYLSKNIDAGRLFIEYAWTLKGKRQLSYSRGLRDRLGMNDEMTDQEIAEAHEDHADLFAELSANDWNMILKSDRRGQLLEVASFGDRDLFAAWMRAIGCRGW